LTDALLQSLDALTHRGRGHIQLLARGVTAAELDYRRQSGLLIGAEPILRQLLSASGDGGGNCAGFELDRRPAKGHGSLTQQATQLGS
jgi:hypothetical protein